MIAGAATSVGDLALFGGTPSFAELLHVGRPNIGDRAELFRRINGVLDRRWLTNRGREVEQFEERVAEITGARHAIAVCNATIGLEIVARALGLTGNVIVPAFTFVASAHALRWVGVDPRFVDVGVDSHLIDPELIDERFTPRTSAVMGVHLWGKPCDVNGLAALARRRGVPLVYDAAHAFGCAVNGQAIGTFGDASVFSFHATKFINSFEGGAIVTNDNDIAREVRLLVNFGFRGYDDVETVGTNGKMNEVCAAMGLVSIDAMPEILEVNRRNYAQYAAALSDIPGFSLLPYEPRHSPNYQYVVVSVEPDAAGIHRDVLLDVLWAENVIARRYFYPGVHRMEPYRTEWPEISMPATETIADRILVLPTGTAVDRSAISRIAEILHFAVRHAPEIVHRRRTATTA
jgi:dTDP-4-amino-4,6-dideoxygalactose transaminase